jgi:hypothetical protein
MIKPVINDNHLISQPQAKQNPGGGSDHYDDECKFEVVPANLTGRVAERF